MADEALRNAQISQLTTRNIRAQGRLKVKKRSGAHGSGWPRKEKGRDVKRNGKKSKMMMMMLLLLNRTTTKSRRGTTFGWAKLSPFSPKNTLEPFFSTLSYDSYSLLLVVVSFLLASFFFPRRPKGFFRAKIWVTAEREREREKFR